MLRRSPLKAISDKRRAALAERGIRYIANTLVSIARPDTGPSRRVRRLVAWRSGGWCEWPVCWGRAVEINHRLNRKMGGRHGEVAELINEPHWLLHVCRVHHRRVTSAHGEALAVAKRMGWVLTEDQDAAAVLVLTRHDLDPVRLLPSGLVEVIAR